MAQCALIQGVLLVTSRYLRLMLAMVAFCLLHPEVDLPRQLTSTSLDTPHRIHLLPLWPSIGHPARDEPGRGPSGHQNILLSHGLPFPGPGEYSSTFARPLLWQVSSRSVPLKFTRTT
jgi:hypothetical protein